MSISLRTKLVDKIFDHLKKNCSGETEEVHCYMVAEEICDIFFDTLNIPKVAQDRDADKVRIMALFGVDTGRCKR